MFRLSISGRNMKIGLFGCGAWGRNHARVLSQIGVLAGICDLDTKSAQAAAQEYGVRSMQMEEVLADASVDGIVVATPPSTHMDIARRALEADKHVLVEKPLSFSVGEGIALTELARSRGLVLMVGHLLRHHPAFVKLSEVCAAGLLGKLQYAYSNRLNLGRLRKEENIWWSFAPHDISMIVELFHSNVKSVSAVGSEFVRPGVSDITVTNIKFEDGASAHIHVSWLHPFKEQRLVIIGEKGMLVFEDSRDWTEKIIYYPHTVDASHDTHVAVRAQSEVIEVEPGEPLLLQATHFLQCIDTGSTPITDGAEACRVLSILEAAQRSMDSGVTVAFDNGELYQERLL